METKLLGTQLAEVNKQTAEVQAKIAEATAELQKELQELQEKDSSIRAAIKESMENSSIKKYEDDNISVVSVSATTRKSFDTKSFKEQQPDMYKQFEKTTQVKASIRITLKTQGE